jgi:hypothetical protein
VLNCLVSLFPISPQEFLKHDGVCTVKTQGGCRLCARITNLLNIHARACRVENCKVPHCLELREQMRCVQHQSYQLLRCILFTWLLVVCWCVLQEAHSPAAADGRPPSPEHEPRVRPRGRQRRRHRRRRGVNAKTGGAAVSRRGFVSRDQGSARKF